MNEKNVSLICIAICTLIAFAIVRFYSVLESADMIALVLLAWCLLSVPVGLVVCYAMGELGTCDEDSE